LAVQVADRISESDPFEERWVYQLRSLAWAALGNALRVQGDLPGAERSFDMADSWWAGGVGDTEDALGYEPLILDLKAPLRTAQRRFPEALKIFDEAVTLFLHGQPEHRDSHLAGRALISKAFLLIEMGASEPAIQALKKANGLIDPKREPRLLLCVHHNLVHSLSSAGRHQDAAALLPELRELAALCGSTLDRLRLDWVDARVATGLRDLERARRLLAGVRQAFLADGNAFDAALVALDLAITYLEEGKTAEVRSLADEMVTVFRALDVDREPLAALLLFQEAARQDTATSDLVRTVAASLNKTREREVKLL
jgi:tetratricopeptide (TPR) repeat protein